MDITEFIERLKQTRIKTIDIETLALCAPNWFLGWKNALYEEGGWRIRILPSIPSVIVSKNWVEQDYIENVMVNTILNDILNTPEAINFKRPRDSEGLMLYGTVYNEHLLATRDFPVVKQEFNKQLNKGFDLGLCCCQISYTILRPLTHWIETPTFADPLVEWYHDTQEAVYFKLEKCENRNCVEKYLDEFLANMKRLNAQLPDVKTPTIIISSPVTVSVKVQEFSGEWVTVGENVKNVTIKICEEGETYIKFYSVKHPDWEGRERTEVLNVVGEISYFFDVNIPKRITIKSVPIGAKITVVKKGSNFIS